MDDAPLLEQGDGVAQAFVKVFPRHLSVTRGPFWYPFLLLPQTGRADLGGVLGGSSLLPEVSIRPLTRRF